MVIILKKSFNILKNNLIFIQPLLMYILLFIIALTYLFNKNVIIVPKILLLISMALLTVAFTAGWLHINKLGITNYNENDKKEEIQIKAIKDFKMFFEGVSLNFFKTFFGYIFFCVVYLLVLFLIFKLCFFVFGEPKIVYELPKITDTSSQTELIEFLNGISDEDKLIFSAWVMVVNIASSLMNFFGVLYFTVLFFEKSNFFTAMLIGIKFFFKNFMNSILIIFTMFLLYILLNLLSVLFGTNSLSFVFLIILFTIYLNYYVLLVFCFYNEKTKSISNSGSECIRQE